MEVLYPSLAAGASVVIASPTNALLRQCSLPLNSGILTRITVQSGATLTFDDSAISLHVREIVVEAGGSLLAGADTCRLFSSLSITFYGNAQDSNANDSPTGQTSKGVIANGRVELHGKQYHPTWTRLARLAYAGQSVVYVQDAVNWEVGQQILITTTVLLDCPVRHYQPTTNSLVTALHCTALHCTALHCTATHGSACVFIGLVQRRVVSAV